ncbi:MAG: hypothetical protein QHC79_13070 [Pseudosphingobacterium sp.]|nr:hypothetical protein [Olivibacter sp. UJ_SKK_5.1]MDX3914465.1 hypothetical protein [Pseudosphingobacterium sp.]
MKRFFLSCFLAASVLAMNACSDDDDPQPQVEDTKNAKYTITVEGVGVDETATFNFIGVTVSQEKNLWKVNGQLRTNETTITLTADDFPSKKTYVVESNVPHYDTGVVISCQNFDDTPIKFTYRAEINGKVLKEDTQTISGFGTQYHQDYQY